MPLGKALKKNIKGIPSQFADFLLDVGLQLQNAECIKNKDFVQNLLCASVGFVVGGIKSKTIEGALSGAVGTITSKLLAGFRGNLSEEIKKNCESGYLSEQRSFLSQVMAGTISTLMGLNSNIAANLALKAEQNFFENDTSRIKKRIESKKTALLAVFSSATYDATKSDENDKRNSNTRLSEKLIESIKFYPQLDLKDYYVMSSNEDMAAFRNWKTNEIVIAFRGTNFTNIKDLMNDVMIGLDFHPSRVKSGLEFFNEMKTKFPGSKFLFTGHSLGGNIAEAIAKDFPSVDCETFNRGSFRESESQQYSNITSHCISGDPFSTCSGYGKKILYTKEKNEWRHPMANFLEKIPKRFE